MHLALCVAYFVVLFLLSMYGLHRSHLVLTCLRLKKKLAAQAAHAPDFDKLVAEGWEPPHITIQLPLYNEATVASRLLEHVAKMDYPREKLEIQVLDDSTDETRQLMLADVERLRATG